MACGQAGCGSNCYRDGGADDGGGGCGDVQKKEGGSVLDSGGRGILCSKCKEEEAVASLNSTQFQDRLCRGCFRSSLFGKFKLSVTSHSMISPSDKVLVAFSGGPASRVALQFVHEMQHKAQANFDASRDRSLPVFGVGVAFIDESAISETPEKISDTVIDIKLLVSSVAPPKKELHVVPIESIFSGDSAKRKNVLSELLDAISDVTGKEDFLEHLRMLSLQKTGNIGRRDALCLIGFGMRHASWCPNLVTAVLDSNLVASDNGYTRLVLGSCASRIACKVISATVKGQGYALPADVQYVDARWKTPVLFPLRDCLVEELSMLCHFDGLKTSQLGDDSSSGINGLVSSFVKLLQEENPSRQRTIVRTAEKLTPFSFNKIPETSSTFDNISLKRRQRLLNMKSAESISADVLCAICGGPLTASDMQSFQSMLGNCQTSWDAFAAKCCQSCSFQILPEESSSLEYFYSLLPEMMTERVKVSAEQDRQQLRERIEDCLLLDDEDEI